MHERRIVFAFLVVVALTLFLEAASYVGLRMTTRSVSTSSPNNLRH